MDKNYVGDADQGKTQEQIETEGKRVALFNARREAVDWSQAPNWATAYETRKAAAGMPQQARWTGHHGEIITEAPTFFMITSFEHVIVPRPVDVKQAEPTIAAGHHWESRPDGTETLRTDTPQRGDIAYAEALGGVERVDMTPPLREGENPHSHNVSGYRRMDDADIVTINALKAQERNIGTMIQEVQYRGGDPRCVMEAKRQFEIAFMFAVKAVAKPADPYR